MVAVSRISHDDLTELKKFERAKGGKQPPAEKVECNRVHHRTLMPRTLS